MGWSQLLNYSKALNVKSLTIDLLNFYYLFDWILNNGSTTNMKNSPSLLVLILIFATSFSYAHVRIDSPKGGESFKPLTEITINWTELQSHDENNWDLYYSLDGGEVWVEIALDEAEASREYIWKTPLAESSTAKIKVIQDNNSGTDYEDISKVFTISSTATGGNDPNIITALEDFTYPIKDLQLTNFPNPFTIETTIQFSVLRKSHVTLNVYNMLGKIVFSGVDKTFDKGTYEISWKSHDFPSGIYLCDLRADSQKIINKMVLRY